MIRLCLSGAAFCSGCNPCEPCHIAIMSRVMPKAMIAGGFAEDPAQAQAFLSAYMQAFRGLQGEMMSTLQQGLAAAQAAQTPIAPPTLTPENFVPPEGQEVIYKDSDSVITAPVSKPNQEIPAETETATELPETETLPSEPETVEPAIEIPPPFVEGLSQDPPSTDEAPSSDTVLNKRSMRRKRGLPRSLRREKTGSK